nr:RNA polymerase factor sigma-54 [uncultured Anaerotignum sp.]
MELSLQMQQKQILSQRMQQSVEILQMNTVTLSEYIREFAEENPLVEWNEEETPLREEKDALLQRLEWLEEADEQNRGLYRMEHEQEESERENSAFGKKEGQSLREFLLFQINTQEIPAGHKAVLRFLAESTAESGYLEKDAIEMMMEKYPMKKSTAARILTEFQALEPSGVGARDLRECLLIQLKRKNASALSVKVTRNYLDELAKNRLSYIAKAEKVSMERLMRALEEIRSCQPKPGSGFVGEGNVEYVVPDVLVERRGEELIVTTNRTGMPRLHISHSYVKLLREKADAQTEEYISEQLKRAEWALQCITKRESTLQQVVEAIVQRQRRFFLEPQGQLVPLRLVDIAEQLDIHESTVSRAVKEKYLQCERGVFPLHTFFSKAMTSAEAGTDVSADSIKNRLCAIIEDEDKAKPLSDRELTERLMAEGIQISRRTVAKYREAIGIAGASGRKQYGERE